MISIRKKEVTVLRDRSTNQWPSCTRYKYYYACTSWQCFAAQSVYAISCFTFRSKAIGKLRTSNNLEGKSRTKLSLLMTSGLKAYLTYIAGTVDSEQSRRESTKQSTGDQTLFAHADPCRMLGQQWEGSDCCSIQSDSSSGEPSRRSSAWTSLRSHAK